MGRAPCCDKANVKKGPWSPEEDSKLKEYIQNHGTGGNWIALPQKAGLRRCGKSCRLRWLNYLRPNIKHGEFSDEEDRIICTLYANIGSRWSIIAAQLPGRTDNDIKNYWNTKLKKKLMNFLPQSHNTILPYETCSQNTPFPNSHSYYNNYQTTTPTPTNTSFVEQISVPNSTISQHFYQEESLQYNNNNYPSLPITTESLVMFGSEGSCCSSSDGISSSLVKQDDIIKFQNFMQTNNNIINHVDFNQWEKTTTEKVNFCFSQNQKQINTPLDYDLEYIKQLISSSSSNNLMSVDENKREEKSMYYYYY